MGNAAQDPLDSKPSSGQAGVTVVFRKGRPFLYGVTVKNGGRFPVRILGVPRDVSDFFKARLFTNKPNPAENERPLERFRPFDLQPGETRWLVLKGVYACTTGPPVAAAWRSARTPSRSAFSFLWKTETTFVPVLDPLTITFTKKGCPRGRGSMTADDYLRSVSFELGDLPCSQRQELLTGIRAHLDELPAGTDLDARLGAPEATTPQSCARRRVSRRSAPAARWTTATR